MKNNGFTIRKRLKSFQYAFRGISELLKGESNCWIHCFVAICVVVAGLLLQISPVEWILITIVIGGVLAAEGFNSAIEALADLVSPDYHELIRKAKDIAAGSVLLMAITAAITGLIIFIPKLVMLL